MKKASKVFIWLGMIFQFFLIYPIVIGVLALKKINRASTREELQTFGIITTLFCSLLGGVFMLCIENEDLKDNNVINNDTNNQEQNVELNANRQTSIKQKKDKKPLVVKILLIVFASLTFAASIVFFFLSLASVYVPIAVDSLEEIKVMYDNSIILPIILTTVCVAATITLFIFILKKFKLEKRIKAFAVLILTCVYLLFPVISLPIKSHNLKEDIEIRTAKHIEYIERNTLKYTNIKIADLLKEIERYPTRYNNTLISLEGYVKYAGVSSFELVFPNDYYYGHHISVEYIYDSNNPRVINNDYVVITGTIKVTESYYGSSLDIEIVDARCEIKSR